MTVPAPARFCVDEDILGLGMALAIARRDVVHPGHRYLPEVPRGTVDDEWIPRVAERDLVVISRDRRLRTKPANLAALRAHQLRVFWIAGKKSLTTWDYLVRLTRRWDNIEHQIGERGPGPWFIAVYDEGVREWTV